MNMCLPALLTFLTKATEKKAWRKIPAKYSCNLPKAVYNYSLTVLTAIMHSFQCLIVMIGRKRGNCERLFIRTGNSRQMGCIHPMGESICKGRPCSRCRTIWQSLGDPGRCCQTGKTEAGAKTEYCQFIYHRTGMRVLFFDPKVRIY